MAIVGHWSSLAEAQKLTRSELLSGIVQEVIETGSLLPMLPLKQLRGKSLLYNREKTWTATDGAKFVATHESIGWTADFDYNQIEVTLKQVARQDAIDKFLAATYGNVNDYRAVMITEMVRKVTRFAEHQIIYGDSDNLGANQWDGLHHWASKATGDLNIDGGETAATLMNIRQLLDAAKVEQKGRDNVIILVPREIGRRFDAAYGEAAFVRSGVTHSLANIMIGAKDIGTRVPMFDGIPVVRTDFLKAEQANSGLNSSTSRDLNTSGTKMYSIFVVRLGHVEEGGLEMLYGSDSVGEGEFGPFVHESFEKLENYIAGGERLYGFMAPALGADLSLARLTDITDAPLIP